MYKYNLIIGFDHLMQLLADYIDDKAIKVIVSAILRNHSAATRLLSIYAPVVAKAVNFVNFILHIELKIQIF